MKKYNIFCKYPKLIILYFFIACPSITFSDATKATKKLLNKADIDIIYDGNKTISAKLKNLQEGFIYYLPEYEDLSQILNWSDNVSKAIIKVMNSYGYYSASVIKEIINKSNKMNLYEACFFSC